MEKQLTVYRRSCVWLAEKKTSFQQFMEGLIKDERGQGTVEYAILVGVLVVIAIGVILFMRPVLEDLWNQIQEGFAQFNGS